MKQPHDNWAKYYDFVYERTFGNFYKNLINLTLETISQIIQQATILDFGAGTGRLAIPLKQNGYDVIAVEKSIGMVGEMKRKSNARLFEIPIFNCSISKYSNGHADLALALFTVLSYSTTEKEISESIENICQHIKPNGYFFFDVPNKIFFKSGLITNIQSPDICRVVWLTNSGKNDIYTYKEVCSGLFNEDQFNYEDEFSIRYWELTTLDKILTKHGLIDTERNFPEFISTGSIYKLYQKI